MIQIHFQTNASLSTDQFLLQEPFYILNDVIIK